MYIYMTRNSFKYVKYSDLKRFSLDFKEIYHVASEKSTFTGLEKMVSYVLCI